MPDFLIGCFDTVTDITGEPGSYKVICEGSTFEAKSVIIAAGSKHRTLGIEGEEAYTGEGISYCAVCDGAFYKDKTVAIIGGGNTALQEAILLSDGCKKVYVIQNLPYFTGEKNLSCPAASPRISCVSICVKALSLSEIKKTDEKRR